VKPGSNLESMLAVSKAIMEWEGLWNGKWRGRESEEMVLSQVQDPPIDIYT